MRESRRDYLDFAHGVNITELPCCKKRKLFKQFDVNFLRLKREVLLAGTKDVRHRELSSTMGFSGSKYFDGRRVYTQFLFKAFRFSSDMQKHVHHKSRNVVLGEITEQSSQSIPPHATFLVLQNIQECAVVSFLHRFAEQFDDLLPDHDEQH